MCEARSETPRLARQNGFVLPVIIFGLMVMSTLAVAAILTSDDEQRSARAMRESAVAFYAAEAGFNEVWASWPDTLLDDMSPGDSIDLGWATLPGGSSYRTVIQRLDNGGQALYGMRVEGRGPGPRGGQRMVSLAVTSGTLGQLGACCDAAISGRGGLSGSIAKFGGRYISGFDTVPPGWESECPPPGPDEAGITWAETDSIWWPFNQDHVIGDPPGFEEDASLSVDSMYNVFGDKTWDEMTAMADKVFDVPVGDSLIMWPAPSLNPDGSCNTDDIWNWGSDDPSHPCYDYHPVVHIKGHAIFVDALWRTYGQGVLLVEGRNPGDPGTLSFANMSRGEFRGVSFVKGCAEYFNQGQIYGALLIDGQYDQSQCEFTHPAYVGMTIEDDLVYYGRGNVNYSSCVVDRSLRLSGIGESYRMMLEERAFSEMLR